MTDRFGRQAKRALVCAAALLSLAAGAQTETTELQVEPPAAFDLAQAEPFAVSGQDRLRFAVIPDTVSVGSDGIVRYVMVVTSPSGGQNVVFEALRCTGDDSKTLARWSTAQKQWIAPTNIAWTDVNDLKSRATQTLARGIFCLNHLTLGSREDLLRELKRQ